MEKIRAAVEAVTGDWLTSRQRERIESALLAAKPEAKTVSSCHCGDIGSHLPSPKCDPAPAASPPALPCPVVGCDCRDRAKAVPRDAPALAPNCGDGEAAFIGGQPGVPDVDRLGEGWSCTPGAPDEPDKTEGQDVAVCPRCKDRQMVKPGVGVHDGKSVFVNHAMKGEKRWCRESGQPIAPGKPDEAPLSEKLKRATEEVANGAPVLQWGYAVTLARALEQQLATRDARIAELERRILRALGCLSEELK